MADEQVTQTTQTATSTVGSTESQILGVSIRGWLASVLVVGVVGMSLCRIDIKEPMYTLVVMAVSFYFGQKTK